MVFYSDRANSDLDKILLGLLNWEKITLSFDHISNYISDIIDVCDNLDKTNYHANSIYEIHKRFGSKVYKYRRNKNTTWYILYDYNQQKNIVYINHIISNHKTIAGTE